MPSRPKELIEVALLLETINREAAREKSIRHGEISIRVYDDRVVIRNPGELPPGITVADLKKTPHDSRLRNPLLAQAFYLAGWIERWGSGTTRINEVAKRKEAATCWRGARISDIPAKYRTFIGHLSDIKSVA